MNKSKPYGRDNPLYGKYKAICRDIHDPVMKGRIRVECSAIFGTDWSDWCLPCLPPGVIAIPPEGQQVWVEFEQGNPERAIWTGVYYDGYNVSGNRLPWQSAHSTPIPGSKDASEHASNSFDNEEHSLLKMHMHPPYYDPECYGFITPKGLMLMMNDTSQTINLTLANGSTTVQLSPAGVLINGLKINLEEA